MPNILASGGASIVGIGRNVIPTFYLASAIVVTDIGKPVKLDTSAGMTVALAGDGDIIYGILESFQDDVTQGIKTGAVGITGGYRVPYVSGDAVAVGDSVVGSATSGTVKKTTTPNNTKVLLKDTTNLTVDIFISGV